MQQRKAAYRQGLAPLRQQLPTGPDNGAVSRRGRTLGAIRPSLYDEAAMPVPNQIIQGDCIAELDKGPAGWVDLVFADPPFNIGYLYSGYDDEKTVDEYVDFSRDWMRAVHRALKPNGSFYLAIGDEYAADLAVVARRELGFHLRNWIVWHYTFGQQPKQKFARSHTHILYFTKDAKDFTFNPDAVRVKSARQTVYKDKRANSKGKLPDDTWFLRPQEAAKEGFFADEQDVWHESRVCGTFKEREGWHGCQMPLGVLDRVIRASSNPGDVVLDPFNGSGTTVVSAAMLGRKYVGIDQSAEYVAFAKQRLAGAMEKLAEESGDGTDGTANIDLAAVARAAADPKRRSKVMTDTDAFGRPRVARNRKAVKTA